MSREPPGDDSLSRLIRLSLEPAEEMIAATLVRQRRPDGIEPGIQVLSLGNEHRASKRARHGITQGLWSLI